MLAEALAASGRPALRTREPGGSPGAERLRALLLAGETSFAPEAETLLHFAARADHVARTIRPALEAGLWVICDRFSDSTMAYQGYGQGAPLETIAALVQLVRPRPDLTLVLDVSERVAATRLRMRAARPDRYERLDAGFHARVRAGFRAIAAAEPARCRLIAGDGTEAEVHGQIMAAIGERFGPA
jgi:dTMP kinase